MAKEKQVFEIPDFVTVRDLAGLMGVTPIDVMKQLINNGIMASINQQIDYDTAAIVVEEMGYEARPVAREQAEEESAEGLPQWRHF